MINDIACAILATDDEEWAKKDEDDGRPKLVGAIEAAMAIVPGEDCCVCAASKFEQRIRDVGLGGIKILLRHEGQEHASLMVATAFARSRGKGVLLALPGTIRVAKPEAVEGVLSRGSAAARELGFVSIGADIGMFSVDALMDLMREESPRSFRVAVRASESMPDGYLVPDMWDSVFAVRTTRLL